MVHMCFKRLILLPVPIHKISHCHYPTLGTVCRLWRQGVRGRMQNNIRVFRNTPELRVFDWHFVKHARTQTGFTFCFWDLKATTCVNFKYIRIVFFVAHFTILAFLEYTAESNSDEWLTGHDFEESEREPVTILSPHLYGGTLENHDKTSVKDSPCPDRDS
jgi:hypothetical protein